MNEITIDQVVLFNATTSAEYEISIFTALASAMKIKFAVKVLIVFELSCVWQYTIINSIWKYTKQKKYRNE